MVKFKCIANYIMEDTGELAFEKDKVYEFQINGDWFETTSNIGWHRLEEEDIVGVINREDDNGDSSGERF